MLRLSRVYWPPCLTLTVTLTSLVVLHSLIECAAVNHSTSGKYPPSFRDTPQSLHYGTYYNFSITREHITSFSYQGNNTNGVAVRINVQSLNASKDYPVIVVVKDQKSVLSWQMPILVEGYHSYDFYNVCRTLCPRLNKSVADPTIEIDVSTFSPAPVPITLSADLIEVDLRLQKPKVVLISPSEPVYYRYTFLPGQHRVRVFVKSTDSFCGILSIQDSECPVYDEQRTVTFEGKYQTISTRGAIAVQRSDFRDTSKTSFFVVLVVKPSDVDCTSTEKFVPIIDANQSRHYADRIKNLTLEILPTATEKQYIAATLSVLAFFSLFYIIAFIFTCVTRHRGRTLPVSDESLSVSGITALSDPCSDDSQPIMQGPISSYGATSNADPLLGEDSRSLSSSLDLNDVDMLSDIEEEKDVFRTKTFLFVSDLSRKSFSRLKKKYNLYTWNLLTVAIFYGLPVIQLVITYQRVVNESGNEDVCYYNFYCAFPFGPFSAFNNIFSNVGYVLLGILFMILVHIRQKRYNRLIRQDRRCVKEIGIPQYFGLFYAMGLALIMEGVLSGCYHVCPNGSNYQFDTAFMYMIGWLSMLKIYQIRHPDVNAHSHVAYFAIAVLIFLGVIGVLKGTRLYWAVFAVLYILTVFMLSIHIYYMGRWKLDLGFFKRLYLLIKSDRFSCLRPTYLDRFILLLIGNLINWAIAVLGVVFYPSFRDFASYLLGIVVVNLFFYLGFYIIMKLRSGERILLVPLLLALSAFFVWIGALYFFIFKSTTSWQISPAMSRERNRGCVLFNFYDDHDVWHFLSSIGLFLSFTSTLFFDDDIASKRRDTIPVF